MTKLNTKKEYILFSLLLIGVITCLIMSCYDTTKKEVEYVENIGAIEYNIYNDRFDCVKGKGFDSDIEYRLIQHIALIENRNELVGLNAKNIVIKPSKEGIKPADLFKTYIGKTVEVKEENKIKELNYKGRVGYELIGDERVIKLGGTKLEYSEALSNIVGSDNVTVVIK